MKFCMQYPLQHFTTFSMSPIKKQRHFSKSLLEYWAATGTKIHFWWILNVKCIDFNVRCLPVKISKYKTKENNMHLISEKMYTSIAMRTCSLISLILVDKKTYHVTTWAVPKNNWTVCYINSALSASHHCGCPICRNATSKNLSVFCVKMLLKNVKLL